MANAYFLFHIDQHLSAIDAVRVEEVFAIPEFILIPDAPSGIVGVVDLRGEILPVLHPNIDARQPSHQYELTDSILVLRHGQIKVGILVNSVRGIHDIPIQTLNSDLSSYPYNMAPDACRMFAGFVPGEETILILSDPETWLNVGSIQQIISVTSFLIDKPYDDSSEALLSAAFLPEEQLVLRQRSDNLRRSLDDNAAVEDTQTMVATIIGGQLFGIASQLVREFITVRQAMPIPCCPPHIVGNINLRGEIMTIVDICGPLGLPVQDKIPMTPKAIVVQLDDEDIAAVVLVDDVRDATVPVKTASVRTAATASLPMHPVHIQGTVPYGNETMHLLNLPQLLVSNAIAVNELL